MMQLKNWKNSQFRKPLILTGARQVGKTYVLKEFGKKEFKNVAYVNCDNNPDVRSLFDEDYEKGADDNRCDYEAAYCPWRNLDNS